MWFYVPFLIFLAVFGLGVLTTNLVVCVGAVVGWVIALVVGDRRTPRGEAPREVELVVGHERLRRREAKRIAAESGGRFRARHAHNGAYHLVAQPDVDHVEALEWAIHHAALTWAQRGADEPLSEVRTDAATVITKARAGALDPEAVYLFG